MKKHDPMWQRHNTSAQDAHIDEMQTVKIPVATHSSSEPSPHPLHIHDSSASAMIDGQPTQNILSLPASAPVVATPPQGDWYGGPMETSASVDPITGATVSRPVSTDLIHAQERRGASRGWRQTVSRRLPRAFAAVLVILVFAVIAVPFLQMLFSAPHPGTGLVSTLTPIVPSAAQSTPNRHVFDWVGQAQNAAQIAYVNQMLSHMTLDEKIGQMIMIEFEESQMTDGLAYEISHYHIGSVILYAYNVLNPDQTRALDRAIQANAKIPVLISTDQEGGTVNRLASIIGPLPSAAQVGATNNPNYARQRGEQDAKALYSLGINANLAPVVDVLNTPTGGAIGDRAFGSTPQQVTKMAGAYLTGLQENHQVVGSLKHFPGLGAVEQDPHKALTTLDRDLGTLEQVDWAPYASLIATGQVDMVMVTHVVMPAVDPDRPASLSKPMITGILRDQLHFNGVVLTDGIYMKALSAHYSFDQIVLYAVEAGVDIISSTYSLSSTDEAFNVIKNAVLDGTLSQKQIDDSVRRILLTKLHYGMLAMSPAK